MSDGREQRDILAANASEVSEAEKNAPPREAAALRMLELREQDLANQIDIGRERLKAMRWLRRIRAVVVVLAAAIPVGMLALLGVALAAGEQGFFQSAQVGMWPKIVVISGTFLTFIFVFGALVKGVFAPGRVEDDDSRQSALESLGEKIVRNSGE